MSGSSAWQQRHVTDLKQEALSTSTQRSLVEAAAAATAATAAAACHAAHVGSSAMRTALTQETLSTSRQQQRQTWQHLERSAGRTAGFAKFQAGQFVGWWWQCRFVQTTTLHPTSTSQVTRRVSTPHLQRQQLLCHHAEHLQSDAVELIKAGPGATLREATEELGHELQQQTAEQMRQL
jgi:hypothetical protein